MRCSRQARPRIAVIVIVAVLITAAAGGVGAQLTPAGEGVTVSIQTFQFNPTPIEVKAGTQITWTNGDDIRHTVTAGTPERRDNTFDAALAGKGATFRVTLSRPGTYPYFCDRHQSMRGEIRVN